MLTEVPANKVLCFTLVSRHDKTSSGKHCGATYITHVKCDDDKDMGSVERDKLTEEGDEVIFRDLDHQ